MRENGRGRRGPRAILRGKPSQDKFELEKADQFNHRVFHDLNNTNEFAVRRAAQRATLHQRVAGEIGAAVRWLVWEFRSWGGQYEPLPFKI